MTHRLASCSVGRIMVIGGLAVALGWVAPRAAFAAESGDSLGARVVEGLVEPPKAADPRGVVASLGQVDGPAGQAVVESGKPVELVKPVDAPRGRALGGPLAGALTVLAPLALGGALWAQDDRPDVQRAGAYVMLAGFAAAPWVSNAITRRWRRAVGFGMASLGTAAGALVAMQVQDPYDPYIANRERLAFASFLTAAFFAAAISVVDSFIAGPEPVASDDP